MSLASGRGFVDWRGGTGDPFVHHMGLGGKATEPAVCFSILTLTSRDALALLPLGYRFHFWKVGVALSLMSLASGKKALSKSYSVVYLAYFLVEGW